MAAWQLYTKRQATKVRGKYLFGLVSRNEVLTPPRPCSVSGAGSETRGRGGLHIPVVSQSGSGGDAEPVTEDREDRFYNQTWTIETARVFDGRCINHGSTYGDGKPPLCLDAKRSPYHLSLPWIHEYTG